MYFLFAEFIKNGAEVEMKSLMATFQFSEATSWNWNCQIPSWQSNIFARTRKHTVVKIHIAGWPINYSASAASLLFAAEKSVGSRASFVIFWRAARTRLSIPLWMAEHRGGRAVSAKNERGGINASLPAALCLRQFVLHFAFPGFHR